MAITRLWQCGFELGDILKEVSSRDNVTFNISSSTKAKTGTYSGRVAADSYFTFALSSAGAQCRMGLHFNHNGAAGTELPGILSLSSGTTPVVDLWWDIPNGLLKVGRRTASVTWDSCSDAAFVTTDQWYRIGLDVLIDASGWVVVYLDGVEILNYSGDTTGGAASFNRLNLGAALWVADDTWDTYAYFDDIYLDDTTGEAAAACPPDLRFQYVVPDGDGYSSQWVGSDSDSVNNYALVDEIPVSGADYVRSGVNDDIDGYTLADYTPTPSSTIAAVIPIATAYQNAGGQLKLGTRLGGTDALGTAQDLGTSSWMVWERQTTKPGGGAWAEANVDGAEVLIQSTI